VRIDQSEGHEHFLERSTTAPRHVAHRLPGQHDRQLRSSWHVPREVMESQETADKRRETVMQNVHGPPGGTLCQGRASRVTRRRGP